MCITTRHFWLINGRFGFAICIDAVHNDGDDEDGGDNDDDADVGDNDDDIAGGNVDEDSCVGDDGK